MNLYTIALAITMDLKSCDKIENNSNLHYG